jgi:cytochrome c5
MTTIAAHPTPGARRPSAAAFHGGALVAALLLAVAGSAGAAPGGGASTAAPVAPAAAERGQLLYETHCIACHDTQIHWRDQRRVQDWAGLLAQVRAWQARALLGWSDADVESVARHLNERIYRLPAPERRGDRPAAAPMVARTR